MKGISFSFYLLFLSHTHTHSHPNRIWIAQRQSGVEPNSVAISRISTAFSCWEQIFKTSNVCLVSYMMSVIMRFENVLTDLLALMEWNILLKCMISLSRPSSLCRTQLDFVTLWRKRRKKTALFLTHTHTRTPRDKRNLTLVHQTHT